MEKINIAELLKYCPKGMELDCAIWDNCTFEGIEDVGYINILVKTPNGLVKLSKEGYLYHNHSGSKCVIFPKGKTTWEGFVPPYQFKDGDILAYTSSHNTVFIYRNKDNEPKYTTSFYVGYTIGVSYYDFHIYNQSALIALNGDCNVRLATEEEKQKLFDVIKEYGYRWNAETKTLEKWIEPKFKVGDKIKHKNGKNIDDVEQGMILSITDDTYDVAVTNNMGIFVPIADQDNWELAPNKFDITTLKPFESKVLVRDKDTAEWRGHFFSHYDSNSDSPYVCIGLEGINEYKRCIPYKGNQHLLGTTNDCDDFYKTWEK